MSGKRRRRRSSDELEKDVLAFLQSAQIDKIADYVSRGRVHAETADGVLAEQWERAMRAMAGRPFSYELRRAEDDLRAEFELRGLEAPWHAVKDAMDQLVAAVDKYHSNLKNTDPDEYRRVGNELEEDIANFLAERERKN